MIQTRPMRRERMPRVPAPLPRPEPAPDVRADWPDAVELTSRTDDVSGYGALVRQVRRALVANGVDVTDHKSFSALESYYPQERTPVLVHTKRGPRWAYEDQVDYVREHGYYAEGMVPPKFGTKARRWVLGHPFRTYDNTLRLTEPGTRDAVRLNVGLPESCDYAGANRRVLYTMWESTEIPTKFRPWAPHLRRANLILVPARHSRRVILDQVPDARVRVVPLALDAADWPVIERGDRPADRPFVFLTVGDLSLRKGPILLYQAFRRAFGDRSDVLLVFKSRGASEFTDLAREPNVRGTEWRREPVRYHLVSGDANVRILRGDWTRAGLRELYHHADCFVWPSLGEGWGYPPREAAATGLPVITCAHTGMEDATEWAKVIPHKNDAVPALFRHWGGQCGTFPRPDVDALAEAMRWMADNRTAARALGAKAAGIVTARTSTQLGADIMDEIAQIPLGGGR